MQKREFQHFFRTQATRVGAYGTTLEGGTEYGYDRYRIELGEVMVCENVDNELNQGQEEKVIGNASIHGNSQIDDDSMEEEGHDYHSGHDGGRKHGKLSDAALALLEMRKHPR